MTNPQRTAERIISALGILGAAVGTEGPYLRGLVEVKLPEPIFQHVLVQCFGRARPPMVDADPENFDFMGMKITKVKPDA